MTIIDDKKLKEIWVECDECPDMDGPFNSFKELHDETPFVFVRTDDGEYHHYCQKCAHDFIAKLGLGK